MKNNHNTIRIVEDSSTKQHIARTVLEELTEWFAVPEAREDYIRRIADMIMIASFEDDQPTGFLCLKETGKDTAEIAVMGVRKAYQRKGTGRHLFEAAAETAMKKGYSFLQVKTVQEGYYEEYDRTNAFYRSLGFKEFEVMPDFWDENNPCQIYAMALCCKHTA